MNKQKTVQKAKELLLDNIIKKTCSTCLLREDDGGGDACNRWEPAERYKNEKYKYED